MARIVISHRTLGVDTGDVHIFFPDPDPRRPDPKAFRTLWLLHGSGEDGEAWFRNTLLELYAQEHGIAVVSPSAGSEFYVNTLDGVQWEDLLTGRLWDLCHRMLPLSADPADNAIAGASMGGYGAMHLGLTHPERYGTIGSFSGGVGMVERYASGREPMADVWRLDRIFGPAETALGGPCDILINAHGLTGKKPRIYMCCGSRDEHERESNPAYRDALRALDYDVTWHQLDYGHEWRYWNIELENFLGWWDAAE